MSLPIDINVNYFYYPIGNTSAVYLTRHIGPDDDARILLLGCGDMRNVLFTCHVDSLGGAVPDRAMDLTLVDYEPAVMARNILLMSLIVDEDYTTNMEIIWSLYYHFRLTPQALQILHRHVAALAELAASPEAWKSGGGGGTSGASGGAGSAGVDAALLGRLISFPTASTTLPALRQLWSRWAHQSISARCEGQNALVAVVNRAAGVERDQVTTLLFGSALPCTTSDDLEEAIDQYKAYWRRGTCVAAGPAGPAGGAAASAGNAGGGNGSGGEGGSGGGAAANKKQKKRRAKESCVNPTFVAADGHNFAHYATDPLFGFHLAIAGTPLVRAGPLGNFGAGVVEAAKHEFAGWVASFRARLQSKAAAKTLRFRFVVSDVLNFCHALAPAPDRDPLLAPFVDRWHYTPLVVDDRTGPVRFNIIDTSNLMDHVGGLNLLTIASPLLDESADAALHTEMLLIRDDARGLLDTALNSDLATAAVLLGLFPVEHLTNAAVWSAAQYAIISRAMGIPKRRLAQGQLRMTWRRPPASSPSSACSIIAMSADDLASVLYGVYCRVFANEDIARLMMRMYALPEPGLIDSLPRTFSRDSWVCFIAAVRPRVNTEWDQAMHKLTQLVLTDVTTCLTPHNMQDLGQYLHLRRVYDVESFEPTAAAAAEAGSFAAAAAALLPGLATVPAIVCVTVRLSRQELAFFTGLEPEQVGTPTLFAAVEANQPTWKSDSWVNIHCALQVAFGEIEAAAGDHGGPVIRVTEDPSGWTGTSALAVSFLTPLKPLLSAVPGSIRIRLYLAISPQTLSIFGALLGPDLTLAKTTLADRDRVFVSADWPNRDSSPARASPARASPARAPASSPASGHLALQSFSDRPELVYTVTAKPDVIHRVIRTVIVRVDIGPGRRRTALQAKAAIAVQTLSPCRFEVAIGKSVPAMTFDFPVPVDTDGVKTRIARKSSYIELEAAVDLAAWKKSANFMFPVEIGPHRQQQQPILLNLARCIPAALPAVNCAVFSQKQEWFNLHMATLFSAVEAAARQGHAVTQSTSRASPDELVLPRADFKETLFTLFHHVTGGQGPRNSIFCIGNPKEANEHIIILVADLRLDLGSQSIILDAAVIPCTMPAVEMAVVVPDLYPVISAIGCEITASRAEMALWLAALPAFAERCRGAQWRHKRATCDYGRATRAPASPTDSADSTDAILCACGRGQFSADFGGAKFPGWAAARGHATRVAIPAMFSVPTVEMVAAADLLGE